MGGVSIISGTLSSVSGAFPTSIIHIYILSTIIIVYTYLIAKDKFT